MLAVNTHNTHESDTGIVYGSEAGRNDYAWLKYFNPVEALAGMYAHVAALPSSSVKERHTLRGYDRDLKFFFNWIGARLDEEGLRDYPTAGDYLRDNGLLRLPSVALVKAYMGYLVSGRGLTARTVGKYMAPVRLWLQHLDNQYIDVRGDDYYTVESMRFQIRKAREQKNPTIETKTSLGALYAHGTRLELAQVRQVMAYAGLDESLQGMRDYALLATGFHSALRVAELGRMTLSSIKREGEEYTVTVRGKRNNMSPVVLEPVAYNAIMAWVNEYNGRLAADDPRRIGTQYTEVDRRGREVVREVGIWQAVNNGDSQYPAGHGSLKAAGISPRSIARMVVRVTGLALDPVYVKRGKVLVAQPSPTWDFSPHDMRRTWARLAYDAGMPLEAIQKQLRHASLATTAKYIGVKPDYAAQRLSKYVTI